VIHKCTGASSGKLSRISPSMDLSSLFATATEKLQQSYFEFDDWNLHQVWNDHFSVGHVFCIMYAKRWQNDDGSHEIRLGDGETI
jgi:hypothetical protein